ANRLTTWNPGILSDVTAAGLGPDNLPIRTTVCATLSPSGADDTSQIQNALNNFNCQSKVVLLNPGTFKISATLTIPSNVVLRGSGSQGATSGGTTVVQSKDATVIAIGAFSPGSPISDGACYSGGYGTVANITQNAMKETSQIQISPATAKTLNV